MLCIKRLALTRAEYTLYLLQSVNSRPNIACSGRRWRGPWAGRDFLAPCRAASRAGSHVCQQRR